MNLEESDSFRDELEKNSKKKKLVIISIILCAFLIVLLFAMIIAIQHQDAVTEKFFLDGKQIPKPKNLYTDIDGVPYVNISAFVDILKSNTNSPLKYTYQKGHYGLYDEDEKSCIIDNGYESLAVSADNEYYNKYIDKTLPDEPMIANMEISTKLEYGYSEKFKINHPIRYKDNIIYVPLENIQEMFNVSLDWKQYRKKIYSFESMIESAQEQIVKIGTSQTMSGYYENLKAILYGYVVLKDEDESNYGVYSLTDGSDRLSSKYKDITFVQNSQEFYITAENGSMGLVSADGETIIKTSEYENISLLDDDSELYMVEKNSEYGVINRTGKTVIFPEYDGIGYDVSPYTLETIENDKLLAEKCIPVEKNKKYGLFNSKGEQILNTSFDALGYVSTETTTATKKAGDEENILIIPKTEGVNGIVINQGDMYGIFDIDSESVLLPCSYTKIYAIRKSGQIIYYIEFNGETYKLKEFLQSLGLAKEFNKLEEDTSESETDNEDVENEETKNENTVNTNVEEYENDGEEDINTEENEESVE